MSAWSTPISGVCCKMVEETTSFPMEINPIIVRESRVRWRGRRGFSLVFFYAALLAVMMAVFYASSVDDPAWQSDTSPRTSRLGAELFMHLTWMQALGWMLLAPALTAPSIAGERENGLLESLYLAPLSPRRIIAGKLASSFLLLVLIMVVALPPVAICFILGGVSPGEFLAATVLHFTTALFCAAIGLVCSVWSRRAATALRVAFMLVVAWGITSAFCYGLSYIPANSFSWSGWPSVLYLLGLTNPICSALAITNLEFANSMSTMPPGSPVWTWIFDVPIWVLSPLVQSAATLLLLALAELGLRRPLPEPQWAGAATVTAASGSKSGEEKPSKPLRPQHAWRQLPIASFISSANPVLQRELRGKFMMRQPSVWVLGCSAPLLLIAGYGYFWLLWVVLNESSGREGAWWGGAFCTLFMIVLNCSVMGAGAFTREREAGTWEPLALSLLPARAIIWGKVLPPMVACAVYSLPLWPFMLPALVMPSWKENYTGIMSSDISPTQAAATIAVLAASAWCLTSFGLFVSWRSKRTATATAWAIGVLFFAYMLFPVFLGTISEPTFLPFFYLWHPFFALSRVSENDQGSALWAALPSTISFFGIGCLWLALLRNAMKDGVRELDSNPQNTNPAVLHDHELQSHPGA